MDHGANRGIDLNVETHYNDVENWKSDEDILKLVDEGKLKKADVVQLIKQRDELKSLVETLFHRVKLSEDDHFKLEQIFRTTIQRLDEKVESLKSETKPSDDHVRTLNELLDIIGCMVEGDLTATLADKPSDHENKGGANEITPEVVERDDDFYIKMPSMPSAEEMSDTRMLVDEEDTEMEALYTQLKSCGMYLGGIESPKMELSDQ